MKEAYVPLFFLNAFIELQADEIEALSSIYGDEWCVIDEESRIFCIKVADTSDSPKWSVSLQVICLI